jgi:hypothetical protein
MEVKKKFQRAGIEIADARGKFSPKKYFPEEAHILSGS